MKVIKGNIIFTPSKDKFKIIQNGYIVLNKNKIIEVCNELPDKYSNYELVDYKDKLMNTYIEELIKDNESDLEFTKEKIIKYARYIGSSNESIYIARIDAIYTFQTV